LEALAQEAMGSHEGDSDVSLDDGGEPQADGWHPLD
jgi:hypothetical protein